MARGVGSRKCQFTYRLMNCVVDSTRELQRLQPQVVIPRRGVNYTLYYTASQLGVYTEVGMEKLPKARKLYPMSPLVCMGHSAIPASFAPRTDSSAAWWLVWRF